MNIFVPIAARISKNWSATWIVPKRRNVRIAAKGDHAENLACFPRKPDWPVPRTLCPSPDVDGVETPMDLAQRAFESEL